jgi:hypothetical protein
MAEIAGLKLIVPSSVAGSGVSVSASGKVTFTTTQAVSINGVFSATYDNYLIVVGSGVIASSAETLSIRLRASGTDATGTNYTSQELQAAGGTVGGGRGTSMDTGNVAGWWTPQRSGFHVYVYGPFLAQPTAWRSVTVSTDSNALIRDHATTHSLSTSYDGFTLRCLNNISGTLTVYGLSQ